MFESSPSSSQGQPLPDTPTGNRGLHFRKALWRFSIFAVALLAAIFVGMPIFFYMIEMPGSVVIPLLLIIEALFAAISASWVGTLLAPDHTRTHLLPVAGISMATAAVGALIFMLLEVLLRLATPSAALAIFARLAVLLLVLMVPLSASWAALHFRSSRDHMGRGAKLTLGLAFVVFCVELVPDSLVTLLALFHIGPENIQYFIHNYMSIDTYMMMIDSYMKSVSIPIYILGASVATWVVGIVIVAVGLAIGTWHFRRRRDWLGMDAAITLCLVGLAPLIISVVDALYNLHFLDALPNFL